MPMLEIEIGLRLSPGGLDSLNLQWYQWICLFYRMPGFAWGAFTWFYGPRLPQQAEEC